MIFAIDIGNTNIVFGCIDDKKTYFTERVSTDIKKTEVEYAVTFKYILDIHGVKKSDVEGVIISCVVPQLSDVVKKAVDAVIGKKSLMIGPGVKTGLNIMIDNPATLGADMVVGAVAAINLYQKRLSEPTPVILFDMGTATTVSVIDGRGRFIGGMILPGPVVAIESLSSAASQLPHISLEDPGRVIGKNTVDCMRSGIIYGYAALTDGTIDRIEEELGQKAFVLATGGLTGSIIPHCRREITVDEDLIMKGLLQIYKKNN
ncbi:MAG: type III pantothenate kinase [Lachnospiraceae bacterium]|nr:type III pantothenate kinase [Lachnospiraceae bacterium]